MVKYLEEFRDPAVAKSLIKNIKDISTKDVRFMEVCGTHTMSIFRSGMRSVLPQNIGLISGPGCPVCVTSQGEIDAYVETARLSNVIATTFGDLIRVPGASSSLQNVRSEGGDVRIVYSAFDSLEIAKNNPDKEVVFFGVGFETTAPTIAATILFAKEKGLKNFSVISSHKIVPPALETIVATPGLKVDGFLLPGHVSLVIGENAYKPFFEEYNIPCVISGFEPVDILKGVHLLVDMIEKGKPELVNAYGRAVTPGGNPKAREAIDQVFRIEDTVWRGLGTLKMSGLKIRDEFSNFDAEKKLGIKVLDTPEPKGCGCGEILTGLKIPPECALYKKACTPSKPIGPCMVSSEGTCAAYYKYHED